MTTLTEQRKISNGLYTFWFFREVRRYGANCLVVGPEEVRDRFAENIARQYQQYFQ